MSEEERDHSRIVLAAIIIAILAVASIGVVIAAQVMNVTFNRSWTIRTAGFVYPENIPINRDYGVQDIGAVVQEDFTITNVGNVPLTVSVATNGTGATLAWNITSATLQPMAYTVFHLDSTITGPGALTLKFNAVQA